MRSHQTTEVAGKLRAPMADIQKVLRLQVSNGVSSDQTIIAANVNASNSFDDYDSPKMGNDNINIPEIYTMVGSEKVAMNGLNNISIGDKLPLGFSTGATNTFTIQATGIRNFDTDTRIILIDNLGSEKDITDGTTYSFTSDAVSNANRFSILFRSAAGTTGIDKNLSNYLSIFKNSNNQIIINCDKTLEGSISVSNALGQIQINVPMTGKRTVINKVFNSGVYLVTVNCAGERIAKKVIFN